MNALREDGTVTIYKIMTRTDNYSNGKWFEASLDHFGYPEGFSASDECWQATGHHGTYFERQGKDGLYWLHNKHPDKDFQLVQQVISVKTSNVMVIVGANHEAS
jgi:hypothetical protein